MTATKEELIQALEAMTVEQLLELTHSLEERLGVIHPPTNNTVVIVGGRPDDGDAWSSQPELRLRVLDAGPRKLHVVMLLREHLSAFAGRPVAEAKAYIESPPVVIPFDADASESKARALVKELDVLGATVELIRV